MILETKILCYAKDIEKRNDKLGLEEDVPEMWTESAIDLSKVTAARRAQTGTEPPSETETAVHMIGADLFIILCPFEKFLIAWQESKMQKP